MAGQGATHLRRREMNLPGFTAENSIVAGAGEGAGIQPQKITLPTCPAGEERQCVVCGHSPAGLPIYCCSCAPIPPQITLKYTQFPNCNVRLCNGTLTIEGQLFTPTGAVALTVSGCGPDGPEQPIIMYADAAGSFTFNYFPCVCGGTRGVQATDYDSTPPGQAVTGSIYVGCFQ